MNRIATNMPNDNLQYHLRHRQVNMDRVQNQIAKQTKITDLREAPLSAAHSSRYLSRINRMERFSKNIETVRSDFHIAEGYLGEANSVIHRVRELAVQAGNGTYEKDDLKYMAVEVNEMLNYLIDVANARGADGTSLFSGDRSESLAFRVGRGHVPGSDAPVITSVEYTGTIAVNKAEINDGSYVENGFPGNKVFWAEQQQVYSQKDATTFVVGADTSIVLDGTDIELKAGDNIYSIMRKINSADVAVKAKLDPVTNGLTLSTTTPHQIWMEDAEGSRVLKDLGLLNESNTRPPNNISKDARVFGGSTFDMLINLRDKMLEGDTEEIGGSALRGIDDAHNNILTSLADLGAKDEKLNFAYNLMDTEIMEMTARNSKETDVDMAEAITNLKMLEFTHKAALQVAGKILQPTLLDYLR